MIQYEWQTGRRAASRLIYDGFIPVNTDVVAASSSSSREHPSGNKVGKGKVGLSWTSPLSGSTSHS